MKTKQIKKQVWDESTKDTPEYDIRKAEKEIAKIKAKIAALKKKMGV